MTKDVLKNQILTDLGANYHSEDDTYITGLLDMVITDALYLSNRYHLTMVSGVQDDGRLSVQLDVLGSNVAKAVKTIYLQRGTEDVKSGSINGMNGSYADAVEDMRKDVVRQNKRLMF